MLRIPSRLIRGGRLLARGASVGALALSLTPVAVAPAYAANSPVNMTVTATVNVNCTFTATPTMAFGNYDPVVVNATTPLDQTATYQIVCTKNAPYWVGLDAGLGGANSAASTSRSMLNGTTQLGYELYLDSGRTTVWGNTQTTGVGGTSPGIAAKINGTIYGRIPAGQDVVAGNYTDTVVVTVNF